MKPMNLVSVLAATLLMTAFTWGTAEARRERVRDEGARAEWLQQRGERGERPERGAERWQRGEAPAMERRGEQAGPPPQGPAAQQADDPIEAAVRPYMRPFWQNERLANALSLSEEQLEALKTSHEELTEKLQEAQGAPAAHHETIREEMAKDEPDLEVVLDAFDKLAELRGERQRAMLSHAVVVKNTLTPEQEAILRRAAARLGAQQVERGPGVGAGRPDLPERPGPGAVRPNVPRRGQATD